MIKTINDKIHIIENYISPHTANFLISECNKNLQDTPNFQIKGGISLDPKKAYNFKPGFNIFNYNKNKDHDISLDILMMLCVSMTNTISNFTNKNMDLKTMFYGVMLEGSKNELHVDNYMEIEKEESVRTNSKDDWSGLLYLNEDYEGGELQFPNENFAIKPKPGTFIFFQGSHNLPHRVSEVTKGQRNVIVSFFWPTEYRGLDTILG